MTWTTISIIKAARDWQFTPPIALNLAYVRLSFATAGIPVFVAQIDPSSGNLSDERRIMATVRDQVLEFPAPATFSERVLALRVPTLSSPFDVQIEVSSMPFIFSGSTTPANNRATTAEVTEVAAAMETVTLLAANSNRKKLIVINNSTATMYLAFGEVASTTNYTIAISADGDGYELEGFTGVVSAVWTDAVGKARITEFE